MGMHGKSNLTDNRRRRYFMHRRIISTCSGLLTTTFFAGESTKGWENMCNSATDCLAATEAEERNDRELLEKIVDEVQTDRASIDFSDTPKNSNSALQEGCGICGSRCGSGC
jgi:hypothetical protein